MGMARRRPQPQGEGSFVVHFLVVHVTVLLVLAFFILFAASKAEGLVALLGNVLGVWVIIVAVLHIVAYFLPGTFGMREGMMHGGGMMHGRWMHQWSDEAQPQASPTTPSQAVPAPATPAPKQETTTPKKP